MKHDKLCGCGTCQQAYKQAADFLSKHMAELSVPPKATDKRPCAVWLWQVTFAMERIVEQIALEGYVQSDEIDPLAAMAAAAKNMNVAITQTAMNNVHTTGNAVIQVFDDLY
jgi:hypothetical protein